MARFVIPNSARLVDLFRQVAMLVIYLTLGSDTTIPELALAHGELVPRKYSGGAFATGVLDNALRERGIATTFFVGTDRVGCVEGTITEAYDRCYQTIFIDDACCSSHQDLHDAMVKI